VNDKTWLNDFIERLSNIEGHFEIYVSLFLKYEQRYVFGLKDSREWIEEEGKKKASLSAIGGRIEEGTEIVPFLKNRGLLDIGVEVDIKDSPHTYLDYHHRLKKIPVNLVKGEIRPQMITIIQKAKYTTTPNMLIFSYLGNTGNKPRSLQFSSLFLAKESILVQMFKNEKTVQELKKAGATFEERIKIPDNLYLYPTGSLNSLLRFLSYEAF
jgi:hypothetical protein